MDTLDRAETATLLAPVPACIVALIDLLVAHDIARQPLIDRINAALAAEADTGGIASVIALRLLRDNALAGAEGVGAALASRDAVAALHERVVRGQTVSRAEWSAERTAALAVGDVATGVAALLAEMAAAAAWPPARSRTVLVDLFRNWVAARQAVTRQKGPWTQGMEDRAHAILNGILKDHEGEMERGEQVDVPALFKSRDPELEQGFRNNLVREEENVGGLSREVADIVVAAFAAAPDDPYLWLEDVEGVVALDQVRAWNVATDASARALPGFAAYEARSRAIMDDTRRIAFPALLGGHAYNFWSDGDHLRGIWRRSPEAAYFAGVPEWDVLLDIDALCREEDANWVWNGALLRRPDGDRCMVALSDGGRDAVTWREYDLIARAFVSDGFVVPEAKTDVVWLDPDTLLVTSDFGPGTLTKAGYAREVRRWARGTELSEAPVVDAVAVDDMMISPMVKRDAAGEWPMIARLRTFWTADLMHLAPDGTLIAAPLPSHAVLQATVGGFAVAKLQQDGPHGSAGSLVAYSIPDLLAGRAVTLEPVLDAPARGAIEGVQAGHSVLYVSRLDDVVGSILALERHGPGDWRAEPLPVAANSALFLVATEKDSDRLLYVTVGMTRPQALHLHVPGEGDRVVASAPERFDPERFTVGQRFTTSADGTRIPYFLVLPRDATGPVPVLLYAYGGFRQSLVPGYVDPVAQFMLESGMGYAVANIRGGGEFGPGWHAAALRDNRQRAFDDLHAVAADLKTSGAAATVGIRGESNGGLLVGVAYTQRPELYDAVIMGVPLADMKRYHKLLAGASWMDEYGDPDVAEDWAFIRRYSPYHNLRADADYPPVLFHTSTKDDRVHPAHARKMAARMAALGHGFDYYENIDGGHGGSADNSQAAYLAALLSTWLKGKLQRASG